ncbi:putative signal transducing protein [Pseudomonas aeruginosa]|uniref:putative signal transducing protein n=2 Tax=Pseudomonas aeruginosa TaxID=287 RepID=UPI000ADDD1D7|nr:DUF2007 domain-containing protein [Pseudomonas aeruginosa]
MAKIGFIGTGIMGKPMAQNLQKAGHSLFLSTHHDAAPADLLEAEMLVGMLASEGIAAHVSGRHLVGAIGELPPGGLLALLVADEQTERARELILAYNAAAPLAEEPPEPCGPGSLLC